MTDKNDFLTGTVKGPGILPHEYLFITRDNNRTRIGEFVYYQTTIGDEQRQIVGTINSRKLVRNLPDAFLADPGTPPSAVAALIGIGGDLEIYEIAVATIGSSNAGTSVIGRLLTFIFTSLSDSLKGMVRPTTRPELSAFLSLKVWPSP